MPDLGPVRSGGLPDPAAGGPSDPRVGHSGPGELRTFPGARPDDAAGPPAPVERLEGRLDALRREERAALVAYGVAGFPDLDG